MPENDNNEKSQLEDVSSSLRQLIGTAWKYLQNTGRSRTEDNKNSKNEYSTIMTSKDSTVITGKGITPPISREKVYQHRIKEDAWMILHNKVYDVTHIIDIHPGGVECLLGCVGLDGTINFEDVGHSNDAWEMLRPFYLGDLPQNEWTGSDIKEKHERKAGNNTSNAIKNSTLTKACFTAKLQESSFIRTLVLIFTNIATLLGLVSLTLFAYLQSQKWSQD